MKQRIRLSFSDFPGPTNVKMITDLLLRRYDVEITQKDPDYVIYSVFGSNFLRYDDAVRIFFTGENVRPDFNLCDYAFSFDWLEFGDRHFRAPNFMLYDQWRDIVTRQSSKLDSLAGKEAFCNFIYTNGNGHPSRDEFFHALNAVEPVESFGTHLRNSHRRVGEAYQGDWSATKVAAQRKFKFTIAFENSSSPGYTTEKLVHALAADTIPIYWGDPLVGRVFNEARFINMNVLGVKEALEQILALHRDDNSYLEYVNRPFFKDSGPLRDLSTDGLLDAFDAIFRRSKLDAIRRNPYFWGRKYEDRRRFEVGAGLFVSRISKLCFWRHDS
jgi:alpha(1,3/1,4) fucosyltransferase